MEVTLFKSMDYSSAQNIAKSLQLEPAEDEPAGCHGAFHGHDERGFSRHRPSHRNGASRPPRPLRSAMPRADSVSWHPGRRGGYIGRNPAGKRQHPGSRGFALPCVRRRDSAPCALGGDIGQLLPCDASHTLQGGVSRQGLPPNWAFCSCTIWPSPLDPSCFRA